MRKAFSAFAILVILAVQIVRIDMRGGGHTYDAALSMAWSFLSTNPYALFVMFLSFFSGLAFLRESQPLAKKKAL